MSPRFFRYVSVPKPLVTKGSFTSSIFVLQKVRQLTTTYRLSMCAHPESFVLSIGDEKGALGDCMFKRLPIVQLSLFIPNINPPNAFSEEKKGLSAAFLYLSLQMVCNAMRRQSLTFELNTTDEVASSFYKRCAELTFISQKTIGGMNPIKLTFTYDRLDYLDPYMDRVRTPEAEWSD